MSMCEKLGSGSGSVLVHGKPFPLFEEDFAAFVEIGKIMFALDKAFRARCTRISQMLSIPVAMGDSTCS